MSVSENFTFDYCGIKLAATIDWNTAKDNPTVLCLHGSQPGNRNYITYLTPALVANGQSCLRFDYAGHGDSGGTLELATLTHLVAQVKQALGFMHPEKSWTIIGASMGGGPALELLPHPQIENIILLAPGAWMNDHYDAPYEERYLYHVKTPEDAARADVFSKLKNYTGNFLHVIGENDAVIAPEVTRQMELNSMNAARRQFIKIKDAPHSLVGWFKDHPEVKDHVVKEIVEFLNVDTN